VLTLRKIIAHPDYSCGAEVKVSRTTVVLTRLSTSAAVRNDRTLRRLFEQAARGVPLTAPLAVRRAANRAAVLARTSRDAEQAQWGRPERRPDLTESRAR
ncbi:MAG TPA: hypothetical protein VKB72_02610, partial [Steroidobacteraceae bacterium]|nr:hypothetical protein [Steroidobacteraceae bacterium]